MRQLLLDLTQAPEPPFAKYVHGGNAELLGVLRAAARGGGAVGVVCGWGDAVDTV